jgi:hypothetical protein
MLLSEINIADHGHPAYDMGHFSGCPANRQLTLRPNSKAKTMLLDITFTPMRVLIDGHDTYGNLILSDGQLAAVVVRLDGEHHDTEHKGLWNLEAGFGKCAATRSAPLFQTLEEAGAWVRNTLTGKGT